MPEPAERQAPPVDPPTETPERSAGRAPGFDLKALIRGNQRLAGAVLLLVLGIVFVMLGWYGAASTNILTEQIPYLISGGLLGLGLIIVAGIMASSAVLEQRTDQMRRDLLQALQAGVPSTGTSTAGLRAAGSTAGTVYVLPDGHSYHVAGCPILEGKPGVTTTTARAAIADGLDMCKLCGPE